MVMAWLQGQGLATAFAKSLGVIVASEIGDKTFFIAAVMAMRNPRLSVFAGAVVALAVMTVLSAVLGWAAPALISPVYTHYAATALFFFFGFKTLWDSVTGEEDPDEGLEAVERELENDKDGKRDKDETKPEKTTILNTLFSRIFLKALSLTFVAEWGDRSQIATIGLAASQNAVGVSLGAILGHAACTGAAVLGGRHLAEHINERTVGLLGGLLFLLFGCHALWEGPGHVAATH